MRIVTARIATAEPAKMITPKIVENQAASSDISQSKAAKVSEPAKRISDGAARLCMRKVCFGSRSSSWRLDQPKYMSAIRDQTMR